MANVIKLSQQHEHNLRKLAEYLLRPELKAKFDMVAYSDWDHDDYSIECGTIGCAAGHGPHAGIPKYDSETWSQYITRVFGLNIVASTIAWRWCFDADWERTDNTPVGAAKRILWLLHNGVPQNWHDIMYKEEPIPY